MGYTHYWRRPGVIAEEVFHSIRVDFERLILPLADAGVELAGGLGDGPPEVSDELIRFNGLNQCGHPKNEEIGIPYPSEYAEGIGPSSTAVDQDVDGLLTFIKHRCCDGRCSYETFNFPRSLEIESRDSDETGLYFEFVKTAFRPYDIAVTSAMLIAKKYLKGEFIIQSDGGDRQWADARRICQSALGYGDWFGIVERAMAEERPGDPANKREVLFHTLVEVDPGKFT